MKNYSYSKCTKCGFEINTIAFNRHSSKCDGIGPENRTWNLRKGKPRRGWSKGLTKEDQRVAKTSTANKERGHYRNTSIRMKQWCKENRDILQENGRRGGGYREHGGRGKGAYRNDYNGKQVWLKSSYEVKCADILDALSIYWIRPTALSYEQEGLKRRYFSDFYLLQYNIYLDPKNDYLYKIDREKISKVQEQCHVVVKMLRLKDLTEEGIKNVLV